MTSTPGYSLEKPEIANGTKYLAVLTAPIEMRPAVFPAIISSDVSQELDGGLDALGERKHFAAGIRQQHAVGSALDQGQARQSLQVSKLKRDRGLREVQLLCRSGDRTVLVNGGQRSQLADGQLSQKPACHDLPS